MTDKSSALHNGIAPGSDMRTKKLNPLLFLLLLLPFICIPAAWVVLARLMPLKWYVFGILALIAAALIVIFRNDRRFNLVLLAFTIGLQLDIHFTTVYSEIYMSSIGYYISLALIPLLALYGHWIWRVMMGRESFRFSRSLLLPVAIFGLFCVLSIAQAQYPQLTQWELVSLVYCLLFFFYMVGNIHNRDDLNLIVLGLVLSVAVQAVLALMQFVTGSSLGLGFLGEEQQLMTDVSGASQVSRASGTLGHPNSLAMYLATLLPLVLGAALVAASWLRRFLLTGVFLLGVAAMVATLSRGGMLVGAATIFIFIVVWAKRAGKLGIVSSVMLTGVAVAALLLVMLENPIKSRFIEDRYETAHIRLPLMRVAFNMVEHNLWLGVGLNNYSQTADKYDNTVERITSDFPHPVHNMFLLLLAEIGIFGFLAFLCVVFGALKKGWDTSKARDGELSVLSLGLTLGLLAMLLHAFVDYFYVSTYFTFWFISGAIVGLWHMKGELLKGTVLSRTGALLG